MGDENHNCRLGVCLLITKVPRLPSLSSNTPSCQFKSTRAVTQAPRTHVLHAVKASNVATLELFALFEQVLQRRINDLVKAVRIFFECVSDSYKL